ncbi:unnamed protein product [Closterium sp. NIES-65]|nr:unnamed protein product [Closterium sp. NIES-65]
MLHRRMRHSSLTSSAPPLPSPPLLHLFPHLLCSTSSLTSSALLYSHLLWCPSLLQMGSKPQGTIMGSKPRGAIVSAHVLSPFPLSSLPFSQMGSKPRGAIMGSKPRGAIVSAHVLARLRSWRGRHKQSESRWGQALVKVKAQAPGEGDAE